MMMIQRQNISRHICSKFPWAICRALLLGVYADFVQHMQVLVSYTEVSCLADYLTIEFQLKQLFSLEWDERIISYSEFERAKT
jgi:hypothetical protein